MGRLPFDPYYKWLGILPAEQLVNHYRPAATDESVRERSRCDRGRRRISEQYLRSLQTGQYSDLSQELLNKISSAKLCLLKPDKKVLSLPVVRWYNFHRCRPHCHLMAPAAPP